MCQPLVCFRWCSAVMQCRWWLKRMRSLKVPGLAAIQVVVKDAEKPRDAGPRCASLSAVHGIMPVVPYLVATQVVVEDDEEPQDAVPRYKRNRCLWRSSAERDAWLAAVHAASTSARLAYCAAVRAIPHAHEKTLSLAADS